MRTAIFVNKIRKTIKLTGFKQFNLLVAREGDE